MHRLRERHCSEYSTSSVKRFGDLDQPLTHDSFGVPIHPGFQCGLDRRRESPTAPHYAQTTLHLPPHAGFLASLAGYGVEIPCILLGGRLSDRYGRKPVNVWGNLAFLLGIYPAFVWVITARSVTALIWAMVLLMPRIPCAWARSTPRSWNRSPQNAQRRLWDRLRGFRRDLWRHDPARRHLDHSS